MASFALPPVFYWFQSSGFCWHGFPFSVAIALVSDGFFKFNWLFPPNLNELSSQFICSGRLFTLHDYFHVDILYKVGPPLWTLYCACYIAFARFPHTQTHSATIYFMLWPSLVEYEKRENQIIIIFVWVYDCKVRIKAYTIVQTSARAITFLHHPNCQSRKMWNIEEFSQSNTKWRTQHIIYEVMIHKQLN